MLVRTLEEDPGKTGGKEGARGMITRLGGRGTTKREREREILLGTPRYNVVNVAEKDGERAERKEGISAQGRQGGKNEGKM